VTEATSGEKTPTTPKRSRRDASQPPSGTSKRSRDGSTRAKSSRDDILARERARQRAAVDDW